MNYIVLAIPVFFLLIGIELLVTRLMERDYYRLADSVADLGCGIVDQLVELFLKTLLFAGYLFVYERRLYTVPDAAAWAWVACFLAVDFLYYWFHRLSHEVNAFWAAHVVHHQSEEYNLTVALRQGAFQSAFSWVFYLPLALLGFSPLMFLALSSANTLYQFWIHTRAIGRLGPLEWVFNTPSNHRVHHARNPKYIDRNHGGTLIVWDRLFGTYAAEEDEPVYGITTPLRSWNPVWANLAYWVELFGKARRTRTLRDKLRLFVKPPGWHPPELGGFVAAPEVDRATYRKFDTNVPSPVALYAFLHFVAVLVFSATLLFVQERLAGGTLALGAAFSVFSLVSLAALFEVKPWALRLEGARVGLLAAGALAAGQASGALGLGALLAVAALLAFAAGPLRQRGARPLEAVGLAATLFLTLAAGADPSPRTPAGGPVTSERDELLRLEQATYAAIRARDAQAMAALLDEGSSTRARAPGASAARPSWPRSRRCRRASRRSTARSSTCRSTATWP